MTRSRLFGTDGMRGPFPEPPLDRGTLFRLGSALGSRLTVSDSSPLVLIAGDTRDSTPRISAWLATALRRYGCRVRYGGVLPSPAIARLVVDLGCAAGIAVSASHNPHPDNGVKLIHSDGSKWEPKQERALEAAIAETVCEPSSGIDEIEPDPALRSAYLEMLRGLAEAQHGTLAGLRVTLDSANGAASGLASELFTGLGAEVHSLGDRPDGRNINDGCGSTKPRAMARMTAETSSHVGFAFDGDADRVIFADEDGTVRDGDAILYLLAKRMAELGVLDPARIVATSMSNLGLEVALADEGIELARCGVGDRIVVRTLREQNLVLGGEQSGHIIHLGLAPTGDGIQTALLICESLVAAGRPLSALLEGFRTFPQVLHNVRVTARPDLLSIPSVRSVVHRVTEELGRKGRLVLRYSGTEPLARVMIEGPDQDRIERYASEIGDAIATEIGAS